MTHRSIQRWLRVTAAAGATLMATSMLTPLTMAATPHPGSVIRAKHSAVKVSGTGTLRGGQFTSVDVLAPEGARCRLTLSDGTHSWHSKAAKAGTPASALQFPWKQPARPAKKWRLGVVCRKGGQRKTHTRTLHVRGVKKGKAAPRFLKPLRVAASTRNPIDGLGGGAGSAPKGTLLVSGSSWLSGLGVDVFSNGRSYNSTNADLGPYGYRYQCVELINRLVMTRGWSGKIWGNATQIFANAPSANFDKHSAGDGYVPVAGDIMVWHGGWGGYGHVAVVRDVSGGQVNFLEQNASANGQNARALQANGAPGAYGSGLAFTGYLHAKANSPVTSPPVTPTPAPEAGIPITTTTQFLVPPWKGGSPVNIRTGPSTSYPVAYTVPTGSVVRVVCQAAGAPIGSSSAYPHNSTWDKLVDGNWIHDNLTDSAGGGGRTDLGGGNYAYWTVGWPRC